MGGLIEVRDLGWRYAPIVDGGGPIPGLDGVSADIRAGWFVGVVGPTGAGKSTFCMALAGIIPNLADGTMSGAVTVAGMDTAAVSVAQLSTRVGYVQQDPESQLFCASMVVIASQLDTFPQAMAAETREEEFISRILDYLNEHFAEELNLEKIAEDMHCSATYVSHGLKKATGMTPINYIIRRRIGLAQTMLISTDLTATQIATMVGYDNTNYFSTLFTKTVGMTPIRYRNMYLEKLRGRRDQS